MIIIFLFESTTLDDVNPLMMCGWIVGDVVGSLCMLLGIVWLSTMDELVLVTLLIVGTAAVDGTVDIDGCTLVWKDGACVWVKVGAVDIGTQDGTTVGYVVEETVVGVKLGFDEGATDGIALGLLVGLQVGLTDGIALGLIVGLQVGLTDGIALGLVVGL